MCTGLKWANWKGIIFDETERSWKQTSRRRIVKLTWHNQKASLRLRLFCMMKYMHQYKQKRSKYFGFVEKLNFFLVPYFNFLKSCFYHCRLHNTIMHNALDTYMLCGPMCQVNSTHWYTWKAGKAWRARVQDSDGQMHEFFFFSFSLRHVFSFFFPQASEFALAPVTPLLHSAK